MSQPNLVILAGGISSRMKNAAAEAMLPPGLQHEAATKPKAMIGVGEQARPFLDYLLRNVAAAGYREVMIVIGEKDQSIRAYYDQGGARQFDRLNLGYAAQPIPPGRARPLGTADALWHGLAARPDWRGQSFTVCNSDNLYSTAALHGLLQETHANAMIDYDRAALQFSSERIAQFAVIEKDSRGFLRNIIEKPDPATLVQLADQDGRVGVSMNLFRFAYDDILPCLAAVPLHPVRQEKELPAAVKLLVERNPQAVFTIRRAEHVPDLTMPSDITAVREFLEREHHSA